MIAHLIYNLSLILVTYIWLLGKLYVDIIPGLHDGLHLHF